MLTTVGLRNLIEMYGSEFDFSEGIVLPKSFGWFREGHFVWTILYVRGSYSDLVSTRIEVYLQVCLNRVTFGASRRLV